jgi:hypothetical protein
MGAILFPSEIPNVRDVRATCASFAQTFARTNVTTAEFMNEPSANKAFYSQGNRHLYLDAFIACWHGIRSVPDAHIQLVPGATAAVGTTNPVDGVRGSEWYNWLYAHGLAKYSCDVAMNLYDWPLGVYDTKPAALAQSPNDPNILQAIQVHNTQRHYGRGRCRVDIEEIGWPTGGGEGSLRTPSIRYDAYPNHPQAVDNATQALNIKDALSVCYDWSKRGIVGDCGIYSAVDNVQPLASGTERHFGLYTAKYRGNPVVPGSMKCGLYRSAGSIRPRTICSAVVIREFTHSHHA